MVTKTPGRDRDRDKTRQALIDAVATVLASKGFGGLGINALARAAGVDKVLIYRYFGGLQGLLEAFGRSRRFWPSTEELWGDDVEALRALPPGERTAEGLRRFAAALRQRPLTLEIMAWEVVEENELTRLLAGLREELSVRWLVEVLPEAEARGVDLAALVALLAGGMSYLALRSRHVDRYNGVVFDEGGWGRLEDSLSEVCRRMFGDS